jgi:hypothetical protein
MPRAAMPMRIGQSARDDSGNATGVERFLAQVIHFVMP